MALTLGQLASGAGVVGEAWRREEDAQRLSRQNQLKIEEQNRLNRFRQNELQAQVPAQQLLDIQQFGQTMPMDIVSPVVAAAPVTPVVPVEQPVQTNVPMVTAPNNNGVWQPVPIVPARPTMNPNVIARSKAAVPISETDNAIVAGLRKVQGFFAPSTVVPAPYRANAGKGAWTPVAKIDAKPTDPKELARIARMRSTIGLPTAETDPEKINRMRSSVGLPPESSGKTGTPAMKVLTPEVQGYFKSLEQQNGIPDGLLAAVMYQESEGKAGLTSGAGARGYFQFMGDTAAQYGVKVNDLNSEAQGAARFLGDLYRKYDGDMTKVLAGYNWGQGNVDRVGVDKAPKETRNYIPQVLARLSPVDTAIAAPQAEQTTKAAPTIVPTVAAKVGETAAPKVQKAISEFYLSNPNAISEDMARAMRQRDEMVRLAKSYQSAGMGLEYTGARAKIMEMDESMFYLQGMQGLNDLAFANDPRRLAAVWSRAKGQPIAVQPRSDGMFNVFLNGNKLSDPYSSDDVSKAARSTFDSAYVKQVNDLAITMGTKRAESEIKINEENAKQLADMIKSVAVERVKGDSAQALEWLKMNGGWDIKPTGSGDGTLIIRAPGSDPYIFNPAGKTVEIDGVKITSNAAYPIAGLPSYSGMLRSAAR